MDIIKNHMRSYLVDIKMQGKKRFRLDDAENYIVKKAGGKSGYENLGGYRAFYAAVVQLQEEELISPISASEYNGLQPALKNRWSIVSDDKGSGWPDSFILKVSDFLDMSGYIRNPGWQTKHEKRYIESIYEFLKQVGKREWASCEERCLELFGDEKFLTSGKSHVLSRLGLSFDDLKMKKYGQMFSYWISGRQKAEKVIIAENHSTFFSFKRCAEEGIEIFSILPGLVIFGDGKRIAKSMEFIDEIVDSKACKIKYFGDIDPEGWLIYKSLRERYPGLDISLFIPAYEFLLTNGKSYPIGDIMQSTNIDVLKYIIREFEKAGKGSLDNDIIRLWEKRRRIPQEFVTYEKIKLKCRQIRI